MSATATASLLSSAIAPASDRMASRATTLTGHVVTAKACRDKLQNKGIVRTGGNSANGLLAVGGASLVINAALACAAGVTVAALLAAVTACPRVTRPINKIADHLQNSFAYAAPARLAACGISAALRRDNLYTADRKTLPYLLVDGKPVDRMPASALSALAPSAVLTSPLLAAIAAYNAGKATAPDWTRAYMPVTDPAPAVATATAPAVTDKAGKATTRKRTTRKAKNVDPVTVNA